MQSTERPGHEQELPTVSTERPAKQSVRAIRVDVVAGPEAGRSFMCAGPRVIVGRAPSADARITDRTASCFHLEISADAGGLTVRDLESLNGTWYHGARIHSAVVPAGAALGLGATVIRVEPAAAVLEDLPQQVSFGELRGKSAVMRGVFSLLARLARTELGLLIEGPTGTGKELAARGVHEASAHADGPFVVLDCTAIPYSLAESTLFGHERGAFTGATERRAGVFEAAAEGTVFLDEVGELPLEMQPKLLRVIEQRQLVRVGGSQPVPMRARVVAATLRDLRAAVNQGRFREDLYYRLAQARVSLPPLRERREDVELLVHDFLGRLPAEARCARSIAPAALTDLCQRDFPGNVRELRHTLEVAAALASGDAILPSDLTFERLLMGERLRSAGSGQLAGGEMAETVVATGDRPEAPIVPFKHAKRTLLDEFERDYLDRLLTRVGRNLSRAAALAGIERHHLRDLLRRHGLWTAE